jgi:superfamily II DNA or RNA helicase
MEPVLFNLEHEDTSRSERQEQGVQKWIKNNCIGCLNWATGVGKTRGGLLAISRFLKKNPGRSVIIAVPSDSTKQQWLVKLAEWGILGDNIQVHTMYETSKDKYVCDFLILDEIHRFGSPSLIKVFENIKYSMILGLTATFERLDGKDAIISKYCPIVDIISTDEAIRNKWLSSYREYEVLIDPPDIEEYRKVDKDFHNYFSFFDYDFKVAMGCATDWKARSALAKEMCKGDYTMFKDINKDVLINAMGFNRTLQARKKYIYNHPRKVELANMILENRTNKKCITFSASVAMAESIGYGAVYSGRDSKKKGRITLQEFVEQDGGVLNTIMKLNDAFDCPDLSVAVILGFNSSKTVKKQRLGRIIRHQEGKEAEVFTLVLKGTVEEIWYKNCTPEYSYIPISEDSLMDVLTGKDIYPKIPKKTSFTLRW